MLKLNCHNTLWSSKNITLNIWTAWWNVQMAHVLYKTNTCMWSSETVLLDSLHMTTSVFLKYICTLKLKVT